MATPIEEKLAWIHELASTLTAEDLVELKVTLRRLAREAGETAELVSETIRQRRNSKHKAPR